MRQDSHAPSAPVPVQEDSLFRSLSRSLPWVISLLFHLSVVLIMMFVVMMAAPSKATEIYPTPIVPEIGPIEEFFKEPPKVTPAPEPRNKEKDRPKYEKPTEPLKYKMEKPLRVIGRLGTNQELNNPLENGVPDGKVRFWTEEDPPVSNVHNIVFVVDRSGSMIETFDHVRKEMIKSIGRLSSKQAFHVIFFAEGKPQQLKTQKLIYALDINKQKATTFLNDVTAEGQTDVLPALKEAFRVLNGAVKRGKLIYLLTDGDFRGKEPAVMSFLRQANKDRDVCITTFLYGNVMNHTAARTLKQIATENGGRFHAVPYEE